MLGAKFGVDDMTVRRYLLLADVAMRSPHEKASLGPVEAGRENACPTK
jgi:hypothetical protein